MSNAPAVVNVSSWGHDADGALYIILAPRSEFYPAEGAPTHWQPLRRNGYGTRNITRELGLGEVLRFEEADSRDAANVQTDAGQNVFGGTVDGEVTQTITVVIDLLDPAALPQAGDFYALEGKYYEIVRRVRLREVDSQAVMTLTGIRWHGLTGTRAGREVADLTLANA